MPRILIGLLFILVACASSTNTEEDNCGSISPTPNSWEESPINSNQGLTNICNRYLIKLDANFSIAENIEILSAWNIWNELLQLQYEVKSSCQMDYYLSSCQIKVFKKDPPPGFGGWASTRVGFNNKTESALISLAPSASGKILNTIVLHEFGHALNLWHNTELGSIMNPSVSVGQTLSCNDKKRLCVIWECTPNC